MRSPTAAPDTADQLQADYFVRLLAGRRGLIDQRIEEYQRKIATAEAKGDADAVASFRRLVRVAEQDRVTLDVLIDKLRRRFVRPTPAEAAVRRGVSVRAESTVVAAIFVTASLTR